MILAGTNVVIVIDGQATARSECTKFCESLSGLSQTYTTPYMYYVISGHVWSDGRCTLVWDPQVTG